MAKKRKLPPTEATAELRTKMPINQREMAEYLGVSTTLLALHEKGERNISTTALLKIVELEKQFDKHVKLASAAAKKNEVAVDTKTIEKHARKTGHLKRLLNTHQRNLEDLSTLLRQQEAWLSLVRHKLATIDMTKEANDRVWLELQEVLVAERIKKGRSAKLKLQLQVELAQAAAAVHEDFEGRLRKGKGKV